MECSTCTQDGEQSTTTLHDVRGQYTSVGDAKDPGSRSDQRQPCHILPRDELLYPFVSLGDLFLLSNIKTNPG